PTRERTLWFAVTVRKRGTARNGSSTAVSVTKNRRYSCAEITSACSLFCQCGLRGLAVVVHAPERRALADRPQVRLHLRQLLEEVAAVDRLGRDADQRQVHERGDVR